jgi:SAM-dependent methyltransferase
MLAFGHFTVSLETLRKARGYLLVRVFSIAALAACGIAETPAQQAAGPLRAPDVPFEPTPAPIVRQMLELAQLRPGQTLYDLGCGDGRIVIAAVRDFGARGVCVDIDPERIRDARANAAKAGVADRIRFLTQDLFETPIADADAVTLFLWPHINLKLRPRLLAELKPGTRVVSYVHDMGDWKPEKTLEVRGRSGPRNIYLWTIPLR